MLKGARNRRPWCRRITAVLLAIMLAGGMIPQTAFVAKAAKAPKASLKSGFDEIVEQSKEDDDTFAAEDGYRLQKGGWSNPVCYDLRNDRGANYVTPVRVQSPFGSCWGFGAIAAAESSIISSGLAAADGLTNRTLDLSEKQIAWFTATAIADTSNPQYGEGTVFRNQADADNRMNAGGFITYATNLFASGAGPIAESTTTEDGVDHKLYAYKGLNGKATAQLVSWIDDEGNEKTGVRKTHYSENDDWSMPEKYRFGQDYRIKESYLLPRPITLNKGGNPRVEYHPEATEAIKEQLSRNHRAVAVSIYADHSNPADLLDGGADGTYMSDNWAQYVDDDDFVTHVVTIVGYDDNYPKKNFREDNQPPKDGAWLVKNSWGSDLEDFPNNGYSHWGLLEGQDKPGSNYQATSKKHTGYFWLSYYDVSMQAPEAYSFDVSDKEYIINQHDLMPLDDYEEYATEAENKTANVFTAEENEKLTDVSIFTATPGTKAVWQLYLLNDDPEGPEDGVCLISSQEKTYTYGGYHRETIPDDQQVIIPKGHKYSVVVTEMTPGNKYSVSFGTQVAYDKDPRYPYWYKSVINKGESYFYIDGGWNDLSDQKIQNIFLGEENEGKLCMDNFPIKVYSLPSNVQQSPPQVRKGGRLVKSLTLFPWEKDIKLDAEFEAVDGTDPSGCTVKSWKSSDEGIFTIEESQDRFNAKITAVKPGTATLILDAGNDGIRLVKVTVKQYEIEFANISEKLEEYTYTGKPIEPKLIEVRSQTNVEDVFNYDLVEGKDYQLQYIDNIKCGKGGVDVVGIGNYGGFLSHNVEIMNLAFVIVPPKAKITKVTPDKDRITVAFDSMESIGVSGYVLTCKESGTANTKTMKLAASASSAVVDGLTAEKTYEISMKAYVTTFDKDAIYDPEFNVYEEGNVDHFGKESDVVTVKLSEDTPAAPVAPALDTAAEKKIAAIKNDGDLAGSTFSAMKFRSVKQTKNSIRLNWTKAKGATGYIIYGNRCGTKYKFKKLAELDGTKKTWTYKKLKKGTYYKFLIVATKVSGDKKKVIASAKTIHVATAGGKKGNYKSVKLSKTKLTLKKGKTYTKLKATAVAASKTKKPKIHKKVRFETSNKAIATVTAAGKIRAKKKGTCYIYTYTQNGVYKRLKLTVK